MAPAVELHFRAAVARPLDDVVAVLRGGPAWLPGYEERDGHPTAELEVEEAGRRIGRRVRVELGSVQRFAYGVTLQVGWEAEQRAALYPRLEGHLRIEQPPGSACQLRFDGRYRPPGGRLGAAADRAVLHRLAEASVRSFVVRVARRLEEA